MLGNNSLEGTPRKDTDQLPPSPAQGEGLVTIKHLDCGLPAQVLLSWGGYKAAPGWLFCSAGLGV